jgi:hypothetical protein
LRSGQSTPDEVLQGQLADDLREKVFPFLLSAVAPFYDCQVVATEMLQACLLFYIMFTEDCKFVEYYYIFAFGNRLFMLKN